MPPAVAVCSLITSWPPGKEIVWFGAPLTSTGTPSSVRLPRTELPVALLSAETLHATAIGFARRGASAAFPGPHFPRHRSLPPQPPDHTHAGGRQLSRSPRR